MRGLNQFCSFFLVLIGIFCPNESNCIRSPETHLIVPTPYPDSGETLRSSQNVSTLCPNEANNLKMLKARGCYLSPPHRLMGIRFTFFTQDVFLSFQNCGV